MNGDETVREACEVPLDEQDEVRERWKPLVDAVERVRELDDGPVVVRFRSEEAMERGLDVGVAEIFG